MQTANLTLQLSEGSAVQHGTSAHKKAKTIAVAGQRIVRALAAERLAERVHMHGAHAPHPAFATIPKGLPRVSASFPRAWSLRRASRIVPRVGIHPRAAHASRSVGCTLSTGFPRVRVRVCGAEACRRGLRSAQCGLLAEVREVGGRWRIVPHEQLQCGHPRRVGRQACPDTRVRLQSGLPRPLSACI